MMATNPLQDFAAYLEAGRSGDQAGAQPGARANALTVPVAPPQRTVPMDDAAQRAAAAAASGQRFVEGASAQWNMLPIVGAGSRAGMSASLGRGVGTVLAAVGAENAGAALLRNADANQQVYDQGAARVASLVGAQPPQMPAPGQQGGAAPGTPAPGSPAATGAAQSGGAAPAALTPQQQQQANMVNAARAISGMTVDQTARLLGAVPGQPAAMRPQDMAAEDYRQIAMADYMNVMGNNPSVEQASAARQQLMQALAPFVGANPLLMGN